MVSWHIRGEMDEIDVDQTGHPTMFSIRMHHGGEFTSFPGRKYIRGKKTFVDLLDIDTFSVHDIDEMMEDLGYASIGKPLYYHFQRPLGDLDFGLFALASDEDVRYLGSFVAKHKLIEVYIEHDKTTLHTYLMSPTHSKVRITEITEPPSCSKTLFLEWHSTPAVDLEDDMDHMEKESGNDPTPTGHLEKDLGNDATVTDHMENDLGNDATLTDHMENDLVNDANDFGKFGELESDNDESDDSDFFVDIENILDDINVDMQDFEMNIDKDVEWVGGSSNTVVDEGTQDEALEVINTDFLASDSSSDEGINGQRKKSIRAIQRAHENDEALVSEPFYIFQKFGSAKEFKDKVKLHAIETRRELALEKNDKNRVRWVCKGTIPKLGPNVEVNDEEEICPWVLLASKWKKDVNWTVKTYNKVHKCLQTRTVKACTYKFLSSKIVEQVESNPAVPIRALQEQLQRRFKVDLSRMKTFRAKSEALNLVQGDFVTQYSLLRDYIVELQTRNPDTTVRVDVESEGNPHSETRTFRRIYICLGALKKGFAAGKRDFLGFDGAFMKGPFPGQILSAVGLDGNNGTYPLAYAVVETENISSWTWFLSCLGEDLGLNTNSNFTFITDRQKGILNAIADLFPCAENRYCVRHIRDNMRKQWRGKPFEDLLWTCATATHVQQFNKGMEELKKLNKDCYEWLKKIPPQHWSRSHFTGRAHSDVILNNLCETFNGKLNEGRDKPIITCLEFIREYLMKKIVNVEKAIGKCTGPLTPTAMQTLENIKKRQKIIDLYFVEMVSIRKWELTGMPCKHAVATIWEMRKNSKDVGIPETWVHEVYWLKTWKQMYSFKIEPINGRSMWEKSVCPTTLVPPKHHVTIGRPKKKRRKSAYEIDDMVKGNSASRILQSVTCSKCNNIGHNARSCKGQKANAPSGSGGPGGSVKGKGKAG
ncbi:unnamed protein product [Lactuca saligna]|uniref:SWIM-type domain-containing protein n=1 Tax=Lactuca saligna TaxID=75948 RepID=A0AA35YTG1_LACSI|nr:unnamed protein product [Lactuca saligna]